MKPAHEVLVLHQPKLDKVSATLRWRPEDHARPNQRATGCMHQPAAAPPICILDWAGEYSAFESKIFTVRGGVSGRPDRTTRGSP